MHTKPRTLCLMLSAALSAFASAETTEQRAKQLDAIVVRASPLKESIDHISKPAEVLADEALETARAGTLGETLRGLAGVQSSQFGQAVARPIVRGLDGARVLMAQGGVSSMDVSALSVDHAVTIEPFLADQIEVLKGPSSLFYGTGAIGGVVNVEDGRLPEVLPEQISGRAQLEYGNAAEERNAVLRADGPLGQFAWHADAFDRSANNYESPDGIVENSGLDTRGAAFGSSWIDTGAHLGASLSRYETNYGVPGEEATLEMAQTRIDAHGGLALDHTISQVEFRAGANNYQHEELEPDGEVGTRFDNDEVHLRLDAIHQEIQGWKGAFGVSVENRKTQASGEEAFLPSSTVRDYGLFWVVQRHSDQHDMNLGLRWDRNNVETEEVVARERSFNTPSLSAAFVQHINAEHSLLFGLDYATRAPQAQELYANGPHIATRSFEFGDAQLDTEVARNVNLGWRWKTQGSELKLDFFHTRFSRFIYLEPTGEFEDDLALSNWRQRDAKFSGFELSAKHTLWDANEQTIQLGVIADRVGAQLNNGDAIPRLSPRRVGLSLLGSGSISSSLWGNGAGWHGSIQAMRYGKPERLAEFETDTDSFWQLDADFNYQILLGQDSEQTLEFYLQGHNLSNQTRRLHTSFLKDIAPLPGRNIKFGVRWYF